MLAASEMGAAACRGVALPPERVERRRRRALELNFGQRLIPGYHGPRWTRRQVALLGKLPDAEVARRTGRTPNAVRQKRETLGIPKPACSSRATPAARWTRT